MSGFEYTKASIEPAQRPSRGVATCSPRALEAARRIRIGRAPRLEFPGGSRDLVELTCQRWNRSRHGLVVHESRRLEPQDIKVIDGIPVRSRERVILDLASLRPFPAISRLRARSSAAAPDHVRVDQGMFDRQRAPRAARRQALRTVPTRGSNRTSDGKRYVKRFFCKRYATTGCPHPLSSVDGSTEPGT